MSYGKMFDGAAGSGLHPGSKSASSVPVGLGKGCACELLQTPYDAEYHLSKYFYCRNSLPLVYRPGRQRNLSRTRARAGDSPMRAPEFREFEAATVAGKVSESSV